MGRGVNGRGERDGTEGWGDGRGLDEEFGGCVGVDRTTRKEGVNGV